MGFITLVFLSLVGIGGKLDKVTGIAWVAFFAMVFGGLFGVYVQVTRPKWLVWGYGLSSGAMVTSASVFLIPNAINHDPSLGGFGVAAGLLLGFAGHTVGHQLTHTKLPLDHTATELTAHGIATGTIIGVVYASLPELGPFLGVAIISHKAPAGYAVSGRLQRSSNNSPFELLLPASAVGVTAIASALLVPPLSPGLKGVIFGFGAG
ncbi:MAG: ZIP family metal transporter, partial [Halobacteriaceae archaeon]